MRVIDLEPNSDEWLKWRRTRLTASEAPAVMDAAPAWMATKTWADLRSLKAGREPEPDDRTKRAWEHGHRCEERVLAALDPAAGAYKPTCLEMTSDCRFSASIDGLLETFREEVSDLWLEIKCPYSRDSKLLDHIGELNEAGPDEREPLLRERRPYIYWQLVQQAAVVTEDLQVSERHTCVLLGVDMEGRARRARLSVRNLLQDWPRLKAEWERYMSGASQYREDAEWAAAAERYKVGVENLEHAMQVRREARDDLIRLAGGEAAGRGYRVALIKRRGDVDWKSVALALAGGDQAKIDGIAGSHRKPAKESWRVSRHKNSERADPE